MTGFKKQAEKAPLNSETALAGCAVPRMAWVTTLLVLVACWAGSSCQLTLTQPLTMSVTPGETAQLACVLSSGYSISNAYIRWYQQKQGEKPRYLLTYKDDSTQHKGSGVPDRFTASKDTSRNTCFLTISRAQGEDDADYYCSDWNDRTNQYVFGGGTQLTVLGQPKASPTVHLFPPSSEEIKAKSKATLVCLLGSFYPGLVQVTWKADGQQITTGVETTKPSKQSDNKFMASSYLSLDASKWKTHETYTCLVTHDGKSFEKSLKSSECS
ncbi:immunoglobulin lambda-1 light chain isoform X4 [Chelonia mydas]|uniref:immunoglobulin lambda-1 light chain isoform X4 n=1 Tax=Chelonia mydas TaxID=8469 RepID=UPI001CA8FD94|nr:immunoglobulin lambda-1 light chain isoform X4 [Chelonia mydas]